jgi:DNA excision repair protein ERCC-2
MGRVIRSPSDYGARILLDGRYTTASPRRWKKYSVFNKFPAEEQDEIIDVEPEKVKYSLMNFFNDMKQDES